MFEEVDFAGKKVLITAGADGLGLEMARVFHRAGARVFVCDVNESRLAALPAELPGVRTLRADVSDEDSVAALFQAVARELGGLDVLVNNAGVAGPPVLSRPCPRPTGTARWPSTSPASSCARARPFRCSRRPRPA